MNKINTYGYCVVKNKNNFPLHIVEINHNILAGLYAFNNSVDAKKKIEEVKKSFPNIIYNSEYLFNKNLINIYSNNTEGLCSNKNNREIYIK